MYKTYGRTYRNPNPISLCHLHELLLSLLLPVRPQHSLAHLVCQHGTLLSSSLLTFATPVLQPAVQATQCLCASVSHDHRGSTVPYLRPFVGGSIFRFFYFLLRFSAILRAVTLPSAFEVIPPNRFQGLMFFSPQSTVVGPFDADKAFESCCCLRSLWYWFRTTPSISSLSRPAWLFSSVRTSIS